MKTTTMFLLVISLTVLILPVAVPVCAQDGDYSGMKGTETPAFKEYADTGTCFVFSKYVVKMLPVEAGEGKIAVYKRGAATAGKGACQTSDKPYFDVNSSDNDYFYGVSGSLLFIDNGTSMESRGLEIYDLTSRKSIFNESYTGDPKFVGGRFVFFDSPSDRKGPLKTCREAAKWRRDGGGVAWVQGRKLDVQTLKLITVGALRCVYMQ